LFPKTRKYVPNKFLTSQLCRFEELNSNEFRNWSIKLGLSWQKQRKLWELAYICQVLYENGMLKEGKRGLGFAVGQERLPSFFVSLGCEILATDLPIDSELKDVWEKSNQYLSNKNILNEYNLCPEEIFNKKVNIREVNMNNIPKDLTDFDFTWSTCSFEHCGNLKLGLEFLENQMQCLKVGGLAVHTTEFNLTSNKNTITEGLTCIYRKRDLINFSKKISKNYKVLPFDFRIGHLPENFIVDNFPYFANGDNPTKVNHLRLNLDNFASTSIGIIIRKIS
jgi:hypothetical protein